MDRIPVFSPWIDQEDIESVTRALSLGWISGTSPIVGEFEGAIASLSNRKYVAAVANGSVALDLAFEALGVGPGDEVILPNFTIISCLAAVIRTGATPVLVDVDPISWNMTLEDVAKAFTSRTKAVLVVHIYGLPAPVDQIANFCKERNVFLVEDAAEAHGNIISEKPCGAFGDISTFSFYANKHVTTGEGGAVCTNSEVIYERVVNMRNLAFGKINRFEHEEFGWNYRISGLASALGISQIKKLPEIIKSKRHQGKIYSDLLSSHQNKFTLPAAEIRDCLNNFWVYGIVFQDELLKANTVSRLALAGIETRPFFHPLSEQPVFKKMFAAPVVSLKNSINLGRMGIYLPTGSHVTDEIQERIVKILLD
jgi:perosamine synthetase